MCGLAREFGGAVDGGVSVPSHQAPEALFLVRGVGDILLVIHRVVVDGIPRFQAQVAAGTEFGAIGVQGVACLDLDVLRRNRHRFVGQVFTVVVGGLRDGVADDEPTAFVVSSPTAGVLQFVFLCGFQVDVAQCLQAGLAVGRVDGGGTQRERAAQSTNVDPAIAVDDALPQGFFILEPAVVAAARAGAVVHCPAGVVACNGGVAPRLDVHNAIALGVHTVHGNVARCTHVHARGPHQLGVVPVVVGKACRRLRHLQGVGVDVAGGGGDVQGPTGLQAAALQGDVVSHQVHVPSDVQAHVLGAAHPGSATAAGQRHVAVARRQREVAVHANLAPSQGAPPCGRGVDGDVALALDDGQVGGAHQNRVGIQGQCAARFDAGLAADGAKICSGGANRLHSGAVQGQVAGFVEDCGCTAAVVAAGVGLRPLASKAQHVFSDQVGTCAVDLARGAGAGQTASRIGLGVPVGQVAAGMQGNVACAVELASIARVDIEQGIATGGGDGDVARLGRSGFIAVGADVCRIGLHTAALNGHAACCDAAAGWTGDAIDGIGSGGDEGHAIGENSGLPRCVEAGGHHLHLTAGTGGGVDAAHREVFAGSECAGHGLRVAAVSDRGIGHTGGAVAHQIDVLSGRLQACGVQAAFEHRDIEVFACA